MVVLQHAPAVNCSPMPVLFLATAPRPPDLRPCLSPGKFTASDVYDHMAQMAVLRARALDELSRVDLLLVPTALSHWTVEEVQEEECAQPPTWGRNAKLGRFTNFVNLLDMCGIAVPSGLVSYDAAQLGEVRNCVPAVMGWHEVAALRVEAPRDLCVAESSCWSGGWLPARVVPFLPQHVRH